MSVLVYLLLALLAAVVLFGLSVLVFGRGEDLPPITRGRTLTALPEGELTGDDLEEVTFALAVRGYRMDEVDWTLSRAAEEIDRLRAEVRRLTSDDRQVDDAVDGAEDAATGPSGSTSS